MNIDTQTHAILVMLKERPEGITALDALRETGSLRLAARISDLKAQGHEIDSQMVKLPGSKKRVARYRLLRGTLWGAA